MIPVPHLRYIGGQLTGREIGETKDQWRDLPDGGVVMIMMKVLLSTISSRNRNFFMVGSGTGKDGIQTPSNFFFSHEEQIEAPGPDMVDPYSVRLVIFLKNVSSSTPIHRFVHRFRSLGQCREWDDGTSASWLPQIRREHGWNGYGWFFE